MKKCRCGFITDNDSLFRCDQCGSILHGEHGAPLSSDGPPRSDVQLIGEVYSAETKIPNVLAVIAVCLIIISGFTVYKSGIPAVIPVLGLMGLRYVISMILITLVSLITASIMGISFGTIDRFIIKMTAVIFMADTIMYVIPYPLVAGCFAFIVCIAMVERYFKLEWDGLIAFVIVSSVIYIFGWLWLTGIYTFLLAQANNLFIDYWRKLIIFLLR